MKHFISFLFIQEEEYKQKLGEQTEEVILMCKSEKNKGSPYTSLTPQEWKDLIMDFERILEKYPFKAYEINTIIGQLKKVIELSINSNRFEPEKYIDIVKSHPYYTYRKDDPLEVTTLIKFLKNKTGERLTHGQILKILKKIKQTSFIGPDYLFFRFFQNKAKREIEEAKKHIYSDKVNISKDKRNEEIRKNQKPEADIHLNTSKDKEKPFISVCYSCSNNCFSYEPKRYCIKYSNKGMLATKYRKMSRY